MHKAIVIAPGFGGRWFWAGAGGPSGSGAVEDLAAWRSKQDARAELVLLVPGEEVLLATVPMPATSPARIARALPFALEEHVLDDLQNLHCAAGPRAGNGAIASAAINRQRLSSLLETLAAVDIFPDHACPDSLCIPWDDGAITVFGEGETMHVRWDKCSAAVTDAGTLEPLLDGVRARHGLQDATIRTLQAASRAEFLETCAGQAGAIPLDLLQGEFLPGQRRAGWRTWRLPATLAAALFLLLIAHEALETRQLAATSSALANEIGLQFKAAFPNVARMQTDPAPQIALELRRLRLQAGAGSDTFLGLLGRAAPVLSANPGLQLDRLQFSGATLEMGLTGSQIADLDRLRSGLLAAGLEARQGAAQLDNERVSGTISVSFPGSGAGR